MTERKKSRRGRRRLALILAVTVLSAWLLWQQEAISTQIYELSSPGLPYPFDGLRIAHLSDLHGKQFGRDNTRLLNTVSALEPDIIAITGDLIDQEDQLAMVPALAAGLASIAPTYYVTGNHEWVVRRVNDLKALLEENGVSVLSNEYITLERAGSIIVLAGIDDPNGPADQKTGIELRAEIAADLGENVYTILLAHRDSVQEYSTWGYDMVFCGHGHGGILRIPILDQGVLSTDRTFFPQYDGGAYDFEGGGWCLVSRGLGSNTTPIPAFRLFNRPHLPLAVLKSS